jgi:glucoselysine-6-phosphate deglycase
MVTLLDCINRIPSVINTICDKEGEAFADFRSKYADRIKDIDEIILIGSGTSNTSGVTAQPFLERVSGIRVFAVVPDEYINDGTVYDKNALYVFLSQTGTSKMVSKLMQKLTGIGLSCISFTQSPDTMLAKESPCHICLNCGPEEYGMRTIGYTASVLDLMWLGVVIGEMRGTVTKEEEEAYKADARRAAENHRNIVEATHVWFRKNQRAIMRSRCVIFTGTDQLYGVAKEAAVKFWEMPQVISMGYELEEGLHGPNYGYDYPHCVVVLNDGGRNGEKAKSLARYMKDVFHNGYVIGSDTVDDRDLHFEPASTWFGALEYSAAVQTFAYDLTIAGGRDLTAKHDLSVMESYFTTHQEW